MTTKHTPGPWRIDRYGAITGGSDRIGSVDWLSSPDTEIVAEARANARLIAAAPDLLNVIRRVAEHFEGTDAPLGIAARAALAKAVGAS